MTDRIVLAGMVFLARHGVNEWEKVEEQRFEVDVELGVDTQAAAATDALAKTIETGEAHYWSRSRRALWHKGATSGLVQTVKELLIDDDQDCVWLKVDVAGGASCHVGYRSCFYRRIPIGETSRPLEFTEQEKVFDPQKIYGDAPNPTQL